MPTVPDLGPTISELQDCKTRLFEFLDCVTEIKSLNALKNRSRLQDIENHLNKNKTVRPVKFDKSFAGAFQDHESLRDATSIFACMLDTKSIRYKLNCPECVFTPTSANFRGARVSFKN